MYLPILHLLRVEMHCKLQGKLQRVTRPLSSPKFSFKIDQTIHLSELRPNCAVSYFTNIQRAKIQKGLRDLWVQATHTAQCTIFLPKSERNKVGKRCQ